MKIGLIGAPGAGKSELARRLKLAIDAPPLAIVDDYVAELEAHLGYAAGEHATYIVNLAIALDRFGWERRWLDDYITCGTVLDSATYMACETFFNPKHEGWQRRQVASLATIGCMVDDMWSYDFAFYLPVDHEADDKFLRTVADEIPTALRVFEVPYITLNGTPDEQLAHALTTIHAASPSE